MKNPAQKKELLSKLFPLAASLLALLVVTVAWFLRSTSSQVGQMSFAAKESGVDVSIYPAAGLSDRAYDTSVTPATLTHSVTWGERLTLDQWKIEFDRFLPGQCEYYLLSGGNNMEIALQGVEFFNETGEPVPTGDGLPLLQCLGFYLIPADPYLKPDGTPVPGLVELPLVRDADGRLAAALLKGAPPTEAITPSEARKSYVLAIFCDPLYGQQDAPVSTLPGRLHFTLSFSIQKQAADET